MLLESFDEAQSGANDVYDAIDGRCSIFLDQWLKSQRSWPEIYIRICSITAIWALA